MDQLLIPRKVLFGNPDIASVQISPDGAQLAYLAPLDGVLNVWVAPRDRPDQGRVVTADKNRGIRFYIWAFTNQHLLYIQDKNGDENWRLYSVNLGNGEIKDCTPFENVQAQVWGLSHKHPAEMVVGLNQRDPQWHDPHHLNLDTGALTLLEANPGFAEYTVDDDYNLAAAIKMTPDGGLEIYRQAGGEWQVWDAIAAEDMLTTSFAGFDKENKRLYMRDSRGRNTSALVEIDLATKEKRLIAEDARADIADIFFHPTEKNVQAVSSIYERKQWQVLDPAVEADLAFLRQQAEGEVEVSSRSLDDQTWIVVYHGDDHPVHYYLYDRPGRQLRFLYSNRKDLEQYPLAKMHSAVIQSRDGLNLVVYYTLPLGSDSDGDGVPDRPVPLVFSPHGGPWWRDFWGFNTWHQWLANRGYAVLMVNFRSSTGYGKDFVNAGNLEWGGKIMEDQVDAVQWAIHKGIADAGGVAVMGGSFGGYSTLAGLTFYPDLFACGVDIVGPSNLITLLEAMPPYWKPMLEMFTTRVGDHRTEAGRELLKRHSPLTYADRIRKPLLIGQGANDPRVKQAESDQIVRAMQEKDIPVTYVLFPDEGHGFARPENNLSFNAIAEAFLASVLEGRFEPVGDDFAGSSLIVPEGVGGVPGLPDALSAHEQAGQV